MPAHSPAKPAPTPVAAGESPVHALVGADNFLQGEALAEIAGRLGPDVQRADIEGPTATPADVFDELQSFAMFGGRRLVVVRDADEFISRHRESLENYLDGPSGQNVLVLRCASLPTNTKVAKAIQKLGGYLKCEPPSQRELAGWITRRGRSHHGLSVSLDAAALLADLIGVDLGSLDTELAKLALQVEGNKVTPDDIAGGVAFRRDQQMWALTDALTQGDPAQAIRTWRQLSGTDASAEFRAITWLAIWLEKAAGALQLAAKNTPTGVIARELKIWPADNVQPLLKTARTLGPAGIRRAVDLLAELDHRTKTGLGEAANGVERFIAEVAGR